MKKETEILEDILKFSAGSYESLKKIIEALNLLDKHLMQLIKIYEKANKLNAKDDTL